MATPPEHTPSARSRPTDSSPSPSQHRPQWSRTHTPSPAPPAPRVPRHDPRHRRWRNAALRIDGRATIHALRAAETTTGGQRVAPACHTGHDRGDDSESLQPIYDQPVTCDNCRTYRVAHDDGQPYDPNRNHWVLPLDLPAIECWPPETEQQRPD